MVLAVEVDLDRDHDVDAPRQLRDVGGRCAREQHRHPIAVVAIDRADSDAAEPGAGRVVEERIDTCEILRHGVAADESGEGRCNCAGVDLDSCRRDVDLLARGRYAGHSAGATGEEGLTPADRRGVGLVRTVAEPAVRPGRQRAGRRPAGDRDDQVGRRPGAFLGTGVPHQVAARDRAAACRPGGRCRSEEQHDADRSQDQAGHPANRVAPSSFRWWFLSGRDSPVSHGCLPFACDGSLTVSTIRSISIPARPAARRTASGEAASKMCMHISSSGTRYERT